MINATQQHSGRSNGMFWSLKYIPFVMAMAFLFLFILSGNVKGNKESNGNLEFTMKIVPLT